ncbi:MAG: tetratricopeptide repeat protein, partial [Phycisphaerae bacterium]
MLSDRGDYANAMEQLEAVDKLPVKPVSMEGVQQLELKKVALGLQALWQVRVWQPMADGPERVAALDKAQALRKRLTDSVAADDLTLTLVDAQLAFISNTPDGNRNASRLLATYNKATETRPNADALFMTAQIAVRNNEPGNARENLERVIQLQPNNLTAILFLAEVEARLQNMDRSTALYRQVLELDPSNEVAKRAVEVTSNLANPAASNDPVLRLLSRVDEMGKLPPSPENQAAMVKIIKDALAKDPADARLHRALVAVHVRGNEREAAKT